MHESVVLTLFCIRMQFVGVQIKFWFSIVVWTSVIRYNRLPHQLRNICLPYFLFALAPFTSLCPIFAEIFQFQYLAYIFKVMHHVCIHKYVFVIVCDYVFLPFLAADAWICIYICLKPYLTKSSSQALGCNGLALFTFAGRCQQFLSEQCVTYCHHSYQTHVISKLS